MGDVRNASTILRSLMTPVRFSDIVGDTHCYNFEGSMNDNNGRLSKSTRSYIDTEIMTIGVDTQSVPARPASK